jgi:peroxiredoxin family protein
LVFSVVLYGAGIDRLYEAVAFLAAARARGQTPLLFLRGPALKAHVRGRWSRPRGLPAARLSFNHQSPQDLLDELRAHGVRVYACSAWAHLGGLSLPAVTARVDAVIGLNAFLAQSQSGPLLYL